MSILLLAECWPYRNTAGSWDTSQTRVLAQTCGLSVQHFVSLCKFQYVIDSYIPSYKRNTHYEVLLYSKMIGVIDLILEHDITLIIGKRLMTIMSSCDIEFCKEYFTYNIEFCRGYFRYVMDNYHREMTIACIPNPLAEFWWKDETNVAEVKKFMQNIFKVYGD